MKVCCVTVPKNFVGQRFCVFTNFVVSKNLMDKMGEGRSITILPENIFVSQCRNC